MSLKDDWKNTGKNIGQTAVGLGKSIVRSVKVGSEIILDERPKDENGGVAPTHLRESWTEVGHDFEKTGKALGKAAAGTARKVGDALDPEDDAPKSE